MPHVVLDSKINLSELINGFKPIIVSDPILIKFDNMFVDSFNRCALVSTVVVEDKKSQKFFIEILTSDGKTTVRLFPGTDPEKTNGVKSALGMVASLIMKKFDGLTITKTNITDFIEQ